MAPETNVLFSKLCTDVQRPTSEAKHFRVSSNSSPHAILSGKGCNSSQILAAFLDLAAGLCTKQASTFDVLLYGVRACRYVHTTSVELSLQLDVHVRYTTYRQPAQPKTV